MVTHLAGDEIPSFSFCDSLVSAPVMVGELSHLIADSELSWFCPSPWSELGEEICMGWASEVGGGNSNAWAARRSISIKYLRHHV